MYIYIYIYIYINIYIYVYKYINIYIFVFAVIHRFELNWFSVRFKHHAQHFATPRTMRSSCLCPESQSWRWIAVKSGLRNLETGIQNCRSIFYVYLYMIFIYLFVLSSLLYIYICICIYVYVYICI